MRLVVGIVLFLIFPFDLHFLFSGAIVTHADVVAALAIPFLFLLQLPSTGAVVEGILSFEGIHLFPGPFQKRVNSFDQKHVAPTVVIQKPH